MSDELELRYIPLAQAILWDRNPKRHDIGGIISSIEKHGFKDPPKFEPELNGREGGLAVGNGRTIALQMMRKNGGRPPRGIAEKNGDWLIPVLFGVDAASQAAAESYGIDHNNLTLLGGDFGITDMMRMWDEDVTAILADLAEEEELPVSIDEEDLLALIQQATDPPPDVAPQVDRAEELQERWQVETGHVWQCGEHYVICGDCREPETWQRLLGAANVEKVNGVFTSPPYAEQRKKQYGGVPVDEYVEWWEAVQDNVRANLAEDGSFFVNIKPHCEKGQRVLYVFDLVLAMVRQWGWQFVDELCWYRGGLPGDPRKWRHFKNEFEPVYHFTGVDDFLFFPDNVLHDAGVKIGEKGSVGDLSKIQGKRAGKYVSRGDGMAFPGNVIEIRSSLQPNAPSHPGAFPVALPAFFVMAYSDEGDVWCDPFLGSGTTIVAAHNNGRRGLGIERLEKYVAVSLQRFLDVTGVEPRLLG